MKVCVKIILYTLFIGLSNIVSAQKEHEIFIDKKNKSDLYFNHLVDESAKFENSKYKSIFDFYQSNSKYEITKIGDNKKTVIFSLSINEKGEVYKYQIFSSKGKKYSKEIERLISVMPNWQPAINKNQKVKVLVMQEIKFL